MLNDLEALVTPADYQAMRPNVFRTQQGVVWFVRQHREELAKEGALHVVAGRNMLNPAKTDAVVLAVGSRQAQRIAA